MVPQSALPRLLQSPEHKARPPTPPRDAESRLENGFKKDAPSQKSTDLTPDSSAESPATATARKKVNWATNGETPSSPVIQPLSASVERKPIKSILKPYKGVYIQSFSSGTATKVSPPHAYPNLAAMLESIAQQLGGEDRDSKLDAYTTLSGTIKASENIPEVRALKDKMGTLLQFMRRDMSARNPTGSWDTQLIVNDLVLLASFLQKPAIAEIFPSDFGGFVIDHAIKTFGDPTASKDVTKHLMFIMARQNFSPKIMNEARVMELIAALHNIDQLVKGKSIMTGRLDIYRNLLRNSRSYMFANTDWLYDLFIDMLSGIKEIRSSAIEFGLEAALVLGTENKISRAVTELFQTEITDEKKVWVEYYSDKLKDMVKRKLETSANVPQIWSVVILFLRCRPRQLEQWVSISQWLSVIQGCFNSSDQQTKLEANSAWNRLVFAIRPDEKTSSSLISMLCIPLLEQFKRKNTSVNRSKPRKTTLSSLCVLLYYSFKPNSTASQIDLYWKQYVVQIVGNTLTTADIVEPTESARQDLSDACRILTALFDCTTPRPWKETRAMELSSTGANMEANELPALDSKWLRKSASEVFLVLDPLLEKLYWDISNDSKPITILWKIYISSIASPAVMEVKVSNDTMSSIASVFNFLYRIWHIGPKNVRSLPSGDTGSTSFLGSFGKIILTTIEGLGSLPFTEKLLSIGGQDKFTVIATPSHGSRNPRGEVRCPLHHLFVLLTNLCPGLEYDSRFSLLVRQILTPFFKARPSSKARMGLVKDLLPLLPADSTEPCRLIWQVLAEFATQAADTRDGHGFGKNNNNEQPLGMDYRSALKILEVGVDLSPNAPLPGWQKVFEALITSSTIDAGDGGRAIAVVEPLARAFTAKIPVDQGQPNSGYSYCRLLVAKATYPKDSQTLVAARRRLWGAVNVGVKIVADDPYIQLYDYLRGCLENSYTFFNKDQSLQYADVISATTNLIMRCPDSVLLNLLVKLQKGISCWILDEKSKLTGGTALSQAVTSLWGRICTHLPHTKQFSSHTKILVDLELLFCSALQSKHRTIVNSAIRLWNTTFGHCDRKVVYPPQITEALLNLRSVTDLQLPFFPESLETERSGEHRQIQSFADTLDDSSTFMGSTSINSILKRPPTQIKMPLSRSRISPRRKSIPQVIIQVSQSMPNKRAREETPELRTRISKKRVSTPKLRHDDSQIQFEAIESSPIVDTVLNSHLLTDRQKEVKERQNTEAAMFPDIRSSPRPRDKSAQRRPESVELPFHRSSSKSRSAISPSDERQATPTLAPQGEYDDFVNSSPTPRRAPSVHSDEIDLPSSPPEARPAEEAEEKEDPEVASSPPEIEQSPNMDNSMSLDPSAQIDPYAVDIERTFSTFEFTPSEQNKSTISDSFVQAQSDLKEPSTTTSEKVPNEVLANSPSQLDEIGETPNTPEHSRDNASIGQQTPKTPVFHDALTSPASSSKFTVNDEVFQDATSSPRLVVKNTEADHSSPLSDLDESSVLRIMTEFDQGSGRPKRNVTFASNKANEAVTTSTLPSKGSSQLVSLTKTSLDTSADELHKEPMVELAVAVDAQKDVKNPDSEASRSSPMSSLIPETPGTKAPTQKIFAEGEEFDPEDTIVVDVPDDFEAFPKPSKRRKSTPRKRSSLAFESPAEGFASKKRKQNGTGLSNEIPESPRFMAKVISPQKTYSKRGRSRPRYSATPLRPQEQSQSHSELEASQDVGASQDNGASQDIGASQDLEATSRLASIDLDAPLKSADVSNYSFGSNQNELAENESAILETAVEGLFGAEAKVFETAHVAEEVAVEESFANTTRNDEVVASSDVEVVAETTIERSSSFDHSNPVVKPEKGIEQEIMVTDVPDVNMMTPDEEAQSEPKVDSVLQNEVVPEISVTSSLKERLQSLIGDLGTVSLSREEVIFFEDMFMDAKEQLYGAGRRGRAAGS